MKLLSLFLCTFSISFTAHAEPPKIPGDSPVAASASSLSLSAVTEAVLANNPAIKEARAKWEALKQRVPQAAAWDDLKVGGSTRLGRFVDISRNGFTDQMLSVEQMIPLSGRNRSRERIAAAEALGALEEVRRKELDVVAKARVAYFRLARDYALLELNRANASSLGQTVEISRAKLEVGNQGQAEVFVAENEVNRLEETRHDLLQSVSEDETQLKVLMNRDAFSTLGRPGALPSPAHAHFPVEKLRGLLLNNRPEVRSTAAGMTAATAKLELAKREWIPDPTVTVQAQRYNGAAQAISEVDAGVSFNVPWLNAKKYRAEEREARSGVEAAQRALEGARAEALGLLHDQLQKIETFHHHVELFETRLLPKARQTVQTNRTNYESGRESFLDLVMSERSLRELEATYQQHLADCQTAVAELEALVGSDLGYFSARQRTSKGEAK
ncbi:MAG: TolC family protein [Chthoniobacter sp.]|uniref:TolC family protein n=1 Tax=Chthoniobacter sp. TaxID=2510640 RepID=UPI0032A781ED